jgi:hypothetical protein
VAEVSVYSVRPFWCQPPRIDRFIGRIETRVASRCAFSRTGQSFLLLFLELIEGSIRHSLDLISDKVGKWLTCGATRRLSTLVLFLSGVTPGLQVASQLTTWIGHILRNLDADISPQES